MTDNRGKPEDEPVGPVDASGQPLDPNQLGKAADVPLDDAAGGNEGENDSEGAVVPGGENDVDPDFGTE